MSRMPFSSGPAQLPLPEGVHMDAPKSAGKFATVIDPSARRARLATAGGLLSSRWRSDSVYSPFRSRREGTRHGRFQTAGGPNIAPARLLAMKNPMSKTGNAISVMGASAKIHQFENCFPKARNRSLAGTALPRKTGRSQLVVATLVWSLLAGVSKPSVFLGRWLSRKATLSRSAWE